MSYLLAFLGFISLIVLHEAGHFAVAKAVGMRVERFSLFFGPLLVKVRRGETEYGIAPIPLGGYVKITGMNPHEDLPPEITDCLRDRPGRSLAVGLRHHYNGQQLAGAQDLDRHLSVGALAR